MFIIAEFLDRSDNWLRQVQEKKIKTANVVNFERDQENTFHPQIDPVSQLLHARKIEQIN